MQGILMGGLSVAILWFINRNPSWWFFVSAAIIWLTLLLSSYFYWFRTQGGGRGFVGWQVIVISASSILSLFVFVEWVWAKYAFMALSGLVMFFLFGEARKSGESNLAHEARPIRRMVMMLWVLAIFSFSCLAFAISVFFPGAPFWLIAFLLSAMIGWVSVIIWQMYFFSQTRSFFAMAAVFALAMWEVAWVLHFLPLGYFVLGAFTAWVWYILHLFARFHMGAQGIAWRRQGWFLGINAALFILILFLFVRWI